MSRLKLCASGLIAPAASEVRAFLAPTFFRLQVDVRVADLRLTAGVNTPRSSVITGQRMITNPSNPGYFKVTEDTRAALMEQFRGNVFFWPHLVDFIEEEVSALEALARSACVMIDDEPWGLEDFRSIRRKIGERIDAMGAAFDALQEKLENDFAGATHGV